MLDKRGNSNQVERILLMEEFRDLFPNVKVASLTAEREFVGSDGFRYLLNDPKIPFRIRIRETERLFDGEQSINGKRLFEGLKMSYCKPFSFCPVLRNSMTILSAIPTV